MKKYIIVIDQGTTSTKILLVNKATQIVDQDFIETNKLEKSNGEILQNANEILFSVEQLIDKLFKRNKLNPNEVASIGITNQRETSVIWNKQTGKPIDYAISWQSSHTSYITDVWKEKDYSKLILNKTGLLISPYFSASKIVHLLKNTKDTKDLLFGTIDSFLLWNLSIEKNHYTDITNASRTMIYNIKDEVWDDELLNLFNIPKHILPTIKNNDDLFGHYKYNDTLIPIKAMAGDQQSALFGHLCTESGQAKITYGTGCFILVNTGEDLINNDNGLISTVAWKLNNVKNYALEGSVFVGGSAVDWMKDKLNLVNHAEETEQMAMSSKNNNVYVVPAFSGLGAPYWDTSIKASILGLEANTTKMDIMKATLNSIAFQVSDVLEVIKSNCNINIKSIAIDGGASNNKYLMQFQADLVDTKLIQNVEKEITGLGVAFMAGLSTGFWKSIDEIKNLQKIKSIFIPTEKRLEINELYDKWKLAVKATQVFK